MYVDENYRVNIYLDTNILVDYSEGEFPLLTDSIDYLVKSDFVDLRSSHYVLFEYTEVRKANLFREYSIQNKGGKPFKHRLLSFLRRICGKRELVKAYIKQNRWEVRGVDYFSCKDNIASLVQEEVRHIKNDLNINFDEHVLHPGLIKPTVELCLNTKISKEDCLVILSCMLPEEDSALKNCVILSRDGDMFKSFSEMRSDIDATFKKYGIPSLPMLQKSDNLIGRYDLYKGRISDLKGCWQTVLAEIIKKNNEANYIGETYSFGRDGIPAECVYFRMNNPKEPLRPMSSLTFISKDLSWIKIVNVKVDIWNNGQKVQLPHCNPAFPKYSFRPGNTISEVDLRELRKAGAFVFYGPDE